jgi:hypothetical protein
MHQPVGDAEAERQNASRVGHSRQLDGAHGADPGQEKTLEAEHHKAKHRGEQDEEEMLPSLRLIWCAEEKRAQRVATTEGDAVNKNQSCLQVGWLWARRTCFKLLCSRACLQLDQSHALRPSFAHSGGAQ